MGNLSRWEVADSGSFSSISCQERWHHPEIVPCDARLRGLRGPNLKDIKRVSIWKTTDLSYVNCHLTPPTTTTVNFSISTVPPGSSSRSGVERELNQGFSSYKRLSTPARVAAGWQKQKATKWDWLFVVSRPENWMLLLHKLFDRTKCNNGWRSEE